MLQIKIYRSRKGISNTVTTVILTSLVLIVGLTIMGITINWSLSTTMINRNKIQAEISKLSSFLLIEHVWLDEDNLTIYLSNPGMTTLRIFRVTIMKLDDSEETVIVDGLVTLSGTEDPSKLQPGEFGWFLVLYNITDSSMVRVYAVSEVIYDPTNDVWNLANGVWSEHAVSI